MSYVISESDILIEGKNFEDSLSAHMRHEDGRPYHTFRTATVLVNGNRVKLKNCRFANTAGSGKKVGQAIALYLDGDDIVLEDCVPEGHQDTLFLAPLPPHEYQKDGFLGPGQFTPRTRRTVYLKNCKISGGVDFIFGGATAYFDNCEFVSVEGLCVCTLHTGRRTDGVCCEKLQIYGGRRREKGELLYCETMAGVCESEIGAVLSG